MRVIKLSAALAEQLVGIREVDDQVWQVSFLEYDPGYFDQDEDRVEPGPNPFAPDTVLTMCPKKMVVRDGTEPSTRGFSHRVDARKRPSAD